MHANCTYHIEVQGQVDERTANAGGPLKLTVVESDPSSTLLTVFADQAGLIGLLRYLHQQGFVLLSVFRS